MTTICYSGEYLKSSHSTVGVWRLRAAMHAYRVPAWSDARHSNVSLFDIKFA